MSVEKEALERRLTAADRRRIFQSLGFQLNGKQPNEEGWITDVLGPSELGEGKRGNFSVNAESGYAMNFGSPEWKGSLYDAVMDVRGCTFPEALEWVAEQIGYHSNGHAKRLDVERLAKAKGLAPKLLRKLGVEQMKSDCLKIPYRLRDGSTNCRQRLRTAISAKSGSLWPKGSKPIVPYGLWLSDEMLARHSYALMLEGESDPWTAWWHGFPALGIPGKDMHGTLELEHVEDFERLYVGIEADEAGRQFAENMQGRLDEIGHEGDVYALPFSEDAPDLNDLYQDDPERFEGRVKRMMEKAPTLEEWLKESPPADDLNEKLQEALGFDLDYLSKHPVATLRRCAKLKIEGKAEAPEEKETEALAYVPFPVDVLPAPAAGYARACEKALPCAPAMVAVPMLSVLASAVGAAAEIQLKGSWQEPPSLWTMLCQPSGSIKSSAVEKAVYPIFQLIQRAGEEHEDRLQGYKEAKARGEDAPEKPKWRRYRVDDITVESVCGVLSDNPRGVLAYRDELAGWFGMMDRYAKNEADMQSWISMYEGRPVAVDRKTTKSAMLSRPAVSVCGTIQPGTLRKRVTEQHIESGFLARLQIVSPPVRPKRFTEHDVTPECKQAYADLVEGLFKVEMGTTLGLTRETKELFAAFVNANGKRVFAMAEGPARSVAAKTDGLAARLALVLHLARRCSGETSSTDVDAESMARALTLAKWLRDETLRVYEVLELAEEALPPQQRFLRKLPDEFKTGEAEALSEDFDVTDRTIRNWLSELVEQGDLEKIRRGLYRKTYPASSFRNFRNLHKESAGSGPSMKEAEVKENGNGESAAGIGHSVSTNGAAEHSGHSRDIPEDEWEDI